LLFRCTVLLHRSNNLNATLSDPALVKALLSIHACGLTALNLEANNLAGSIPDDYAQLVNLKVLNLGEQQQYVFLKLSVGEGSPACLSNNTAASAICSSQQQQPSAAGSDPSRACWQQASTVATKCSSL
jgi:hypothetical protein